MTKADFDFQPTLSGSLVTVRPLVESDFEAVYAAAADPLVWEQHPDPSRYQREVFTKNFFAGAVSSGSAFVVLDRATGSVIGSSRYYDWEPTTREVAIGYTFLAKSHWGGTYNGELKRLMMEHAFRWARVIWFHIGPENWRSRRATEKVGARYSHDGTKIINGTPHPYSFYRFDAP